MGIYRRGKVYWARWVEQGKLQRRSLETSDRREAERRFEEITTEAPGGIAVREILKRWFEYQKPRCKPRSLPLYKIVKKRFSLVSAPSEPTVQVRSALQSKSGTYPSSDWFWRTERR